MTPRRETIHPRDEAHWLSLRSRDLTSTDIAALFGASPYKTHYELWHEHAHGDVREFQDSERMTWGRRLESAIAEGITEDQDWVTRPMKEYIRLPDERIGSSFDYRIIASEEGRAAAYPGIDSPADAILEIKVVDWLAFKRGWIVDQDYIEAPAHIEWQVQHQTLVSGLSECYIGALVGGNDVRLLHRRALPEVHAAILQACRDFWQSIADNNPPPPIMPDDADAIIRQCGYAEPGTLLEAHDDAELTALVRAYHAAGVDEKTAADVRKSLKADILLRIGEHERVVGEGWKIAAGTVAPSAGKVITPEMVGEIIGARAGYRGMRLTFKG